MSNVSKRNYPHYSLRSSERNRSTQRKVQFESLELRRVLANTAGDLPQLAGDSNADGVFDQRDLVAVFQAGKYETDQVATWAEGDWSGDGRFNSEDLVLTMQLGTYNAAPNPIAAEMDEPAEEEGENTLKSFASMLSNKIRERAEAMRDAFFQRMEEEGADLDGLGEAFANRDFDAIRELMGGKDDEDELDEGDEGDEDELDEDDEGEESLKDRLFGRIGERLESFRGKIEEWKSEGRPETDRTEERITALREALANGKFEGLDETALAQLNEALEQGELKAAMKVIHENLRGKDKPEEGEDAGVNRRIAWGIKHVEAAVEAGRIDAEGGQQLIAALEANDFKAYRELWRSLLKSRDEEA